MLIKTLFVAEILIDDCQHELKVPAINNMDSIWQQHNLKAKSKVNNELSPKKPTLKRHLSFFLISNTGGESGSFLTFRTKELCHCQQSPVPKAPFKPRPGEQQRGWADTGCLGRPGSQSLLQRKQWTANPGWREPPWPHTRHPHPVLSALEKFGGKLPRTQWESSVPNRSCQNTSWFSVGHKKSNFPLLKYSFHLSYKPLFPEFVKSI